MVASRGLDMQACTWLLALFGSTGSDAESFIDLECMYFSSMQQSVNNGMWNEVET
jgi:hypothetical protein